MVLRIAFKLSRGRHIDTEYSIGAISIDSLFMAMLNAIQINSFILRPFSCKAFLLKLAGEEGEARKVDNPERDNPTQPSPHGGFRDRRISTRTFDPFDSYSIVHLLESDGKNNQTKRYMEVVLRRTPAIHNARCFEVMNEEAHNDLGTVENKKSEASLFVRVHKIPACHDRVRETYACSYTSENDRAGKEEVDDHMQPYPMSVKSAEVSCA